MKYRKLVFMTDRPHIYFPTKLVNFSRNATTATHPVFQINPSEKDVMGGPQDPAAEVFHIGGTKQDRTENSPGPRGKESI